MEYPKLPLILFLLPVLEITLVVGEPQVPCYFIFGDSLVDNGNNNFRQTESKADFLPYGIDFAEGPTGRFSNGRNIADIIAELLGFDKYIAPFANATKRDFIRGVNYGSGGAGILDETGRQLGNIISFNEQLLNHKTTISRLAKLLGGGNLAKQHLSKCIYSVGMGNNDYLLNYLPQYYASSSPYTPDQFAALLITQYSNQLQKLYKYGARKVAVSSLGSIGCIPQQRAMNGSYCMETSNDAVKFFNDKLNILIGYLNNQLHDATILYMDHRPSSFGNMTNLIQPCCAELSSQGDGRCLAGTVPCANRDEYYFWDITHPTEAASIINGKVAYENMSPLYVDLVQTS